MSSVTLETEAWAREQFGSCQLGDKRRTKRAVKYATQVAAHPDGSTPDQVERWSDLKAVYRLFDQEEVTFDALCEPHWQLTRAQATGVCLVINDTTELNFGEHRKTTGLGPVGRGRGAGFFLHSALMVQVQADSYEIVGLAGQEIFYRQLRPKGDNTYRRTQRARESEVWGRVIDRVGPPAEGVRYIHVDDRGADNLEVFCHLLHQRCGWVVRASQLHRTVRDAQNQSHKLRELLERQPLQESYELKVPEAVGRPKRTAKLEVRWAQVTLPRSAKRSSPYLKKMGFQGLTQWVVEAREVNPPAGVEALHWVLYTSESIGSFADAQRILEYYKQRWLIEEYHKALKTGCRAEGRQYETSERLEAVTAILSIVAMRLVQMKCIARREPNTPAEQVVPRVWLKMLESLRKRPILTVRDFLRQLAGLGGHLGRKGDGEPGWITLWRGTEKLILCIRGHLAMAKRCG